MNFILVSSLPNIPHKQCAYLVKDSWNDWFYWQTQFTLVYSDAESKYHNIGSVKIGQDRMRRSSNGSTEETSIAFKPILPESFDSLKKDYFSLGQSENYYETLNALPSDSKREILTGLRDVAFDINIYHEYSGHEAMIESLLRDISERHVLEGLHKLARGQSHFNGFDFSYLFPYQDHANRPVSLRFNIEPKASPPSNIQAIIGRNGVGKTTLFAGFIKGIINKNSIPEQNVGWLTTPDENGRLVNKPDYFTSLTLLSYSPFDKFGPVDLDDIPSGVKYQYIGLMSFTQDKNYLTPKSFGVLHNEFCKSMKECLIGVRKKRWQDCLEILENDPLFKESDVSKLADFDGNSDDNSWENYVRKYLEKLSSGHLVTLLSITRLIEAIEDRSLTLIDEPEAHLHPPLISAFIRAVSHLMSDRNGVAIVATHSPVVLQEVRSDCVWILNRTGKYMSADRPQIETFGENVGTLTREIFSHEVINTGFYKMIIDASKTHETFESLNSHFDQKLGGEARALARSLINNKKKG
ncbi:cytochrome c biogenesis protein CcmA [Serratia marcescens]|nr:AAA family ATPase [Serratia marcescens]CVG22572.1 cytochrome c biogenesis protein CcmA [Serratia marcescens]